MLTTCQATRRLEVPRATGPTPCPDSPFGRSLYGRRARAGLTCRCEVREADAEEGGATLDRHGGASRLGLVPRRGGVPDVPEKPPGDRQRGGADVLGAWRGRPLPRGGHHSPSR